MLFQYLIANPKTSPLLTIHARFSSTSSNPKSGHSWWKYQNDTKNHKKFCLECMADHIFLPFVWCFAPFSRMNQSTPSSCTICVLTSKRKFNLSLNYVNYNADYNRDYRLDSKYNLPWKVLWRSRPAKARWKYHNGGVKK